MQFFTFIAKLVGLLDWIKKLIPYFQRMYDARMRRKAQERLAKALKIAETEKNTDALERLFRDP